MPAVFQLHPIAGIAIALAVVALLAAAFFAARVMRLPRGSEEMIRISDAIREGAMAYLKRQFSAISLIAIILFLVLGLWADGRWYIAVPFLIGAVASGLAAFVGMSTSVRANVRTTEAARHGLKRGLDVAVWGGAVNGLFVVGLSLLGVAVLYLVMLQILPGSAMLGARSAQAVAPMALIGFGFGASLVSLFARVGGGIFTKAADVGADLVGKVEKGIPEDDPRNPAVIADNVGDNVGDCAGMGADLFETYAVTLIAAMILATSTVREGAGQQAAVEYPLALGAVAIIASIIGIFAIRLGRKKKIMGALYKGLAVSTVLAAVGFYFVTGLVFERQWIPSTGYAPLFWAGIVGLAITVLINVITEYYTGKYAPVREIAKASETGAGTNVIAGLAVGLKSTVFPVLVIAFGTFVAYHLGSLWRPGQGIYGVAVAAVAMLSTTGLIITMDTYGPITDNAGGIAEMAGLPENVREVTDELDSVGNTTKAVTKGYAIGSAALAALVLFQAFVEAVSSAPGKSYDQHLVLVLTETNVFVGLLIGTMLPFLFSAWCMQAVGRAAHKVVEEVRRQFREIPGIMERTAKPEYGTAVDIVTKAALREMILPGVLAVTAPVIVGWLLGAKGLGGMLAGVIAASLLLALQMANGGGAWDNAKKLLEQEGKKGTDAHKAAVVGDTVGDPFKDTAGPSLNALIKVINTIALIIAAGLAMNLEGHLQDIFR